MAKVRMSVQARHDLVSVLTHLTAVAGARVARKYDTKFKRELSRVRHFPGCGSPRPEYGPQTRLLTVNPYLTFYDGGPRSKVVHVLRILDGRRDLTPEIVGRGRTP